MDVFLLFNWSRMSRFLHLDHGIGYSPIISEIISKLRKQDHSGHTFECCSMLLIKPWSAEGKNAGVKCIGLNDICMPGQVALTKN